MTNIKEIKPDEIWNEKKKEDLKNFISLQSNEQTHERKLRNELLAIQYKIEDYIENNQDGNQLMVLDFVKMYLKVLNITQRKLAVLFEMKDSNLHKYLVGERKLNASLILKLSSFSHTSPEHWLKIQVKNELIEINKERECFDKYKKYDYTNLIVSSAN